MSALKYLCWKQFVYVIQFDHFLIWLILTSGNVTPEGKSRIQGLFFMFANTYRAFTWSCLESKSIQRAILDDAGGIFY